jgi:lipopolysaccharide heptosyltransferase II
MLRENSVDQGRDNRLFIADDSREERFLVVQLSNEVVAQFIFHGFNPIAAAFQLTKRGGTIHGIASINLLCANVVGFTLKIKQARRRVANPDKKLYHRGHVMIFSPDKTLIVRFSSVGDILLSSLLVRTFRKRFPSCRLDFVVKEEYADLVQHNPNLTNVLPFARNGTFAELQELRATIQRTRYDLVIDIHDSVRSRFLSLGAKRVVRIDKRKLARFLLVKLKINMYEEFGGAPSVALRYLEPVSHLGVEDDGNGLECFVSEKERETADALLSRAGFGTQKKFIGICPSAKHANKMWPAENFAGVASEVWNRHHQPIVLFGSESEVERCIEIEGRIRGATRECQVLNLAGKVNLMETAAVMDRCPMVISNDSGLMHLAASRKRSVLAVFGPTVQELGFFPFGTKSLVIENEGLKCRPCTHIGLTTCPKGHFRCMNDITIERVTDAAHMLLRDA